MVIVLVLGGLNNINTDTSCTRQIHIVLTKTQFTELDIYHGSIFIFIKLVLIFSLISHRDARQQDRI